MGEIELGAETNREPNKYAKLTAYYAYHQVLAADLPADVDRSGGLDREEARRRIKSLACEIQRRC